jgi:hypothetical protein
MHHWTLFIWKWWMHSQCLVAILGGKFMCWRKIFRSSFFSTYFFAFC